MRLKCETCPTMLPPDRALPCKKCGLEPLCEACLAMHVCDISEEDTEPSELVIDSDDDELDHRWGDDPEEPAQ